MNEVNNLYEVDLKFASALEASYLKKKEPLPKLGEELIVVEEYFLDIPLSELCKKVDLLFDLTIRKEWDNSLNILFYTGERLETSLRLFKRFHQFKEEITKDREASKSTKEKVSEILSTATSAASEIFAKIFSSNSEKAAISSDNKDHDSNHHPFLEPSIKILTNYIVTCDTALNFGACSVQVLINCSTLYKELESLMVGISRNSSCTKALEAYNRRTGKIRIQDRLGIDNSVKGACSFTLFPLLLHVTYFFGEVAGKVREEEVKQLIAKIEKKNWYRPSSLGSSYNFFKFLDKCPSKTVSLTEEEKNFLTIITSRLNNGLHISHQINDLNMRVDKDLTSEKKQEREKQRAIFRDVFIQQVEKLEIGQGFVFYSGYEAEGEKKTGHAILYEIERQYSGDIKLRMINTGEGMQESEGEERSANTMFQLFDIDSNLKDEVLYKVLFNFDNEFKDTVQITLHLLCTSIRPNQSRKRICEEFGFAPQLHGSCTFLPLLVWLKRHSVVHFGQKKGCEVYLKLQSAFVLYCLKKISMCQFPEKYSSSAKEKYYSVAREVAQLGWSIW